MIFYIFPDVGIPPAQNRMIMVMFLILKIFNLFIFISATTFRRSNAKNPVRLFYTVTRLFFKFSSTPTAKICRRIFG